MQGDRGNGSLYIALVSVRHQQRDYTVYRYSM